MKLIIFSPVTYIFFNKHSKKALFICTTSQPLGMQYILNWPPDYKCVILFANIYIFYLENSFILKVVRDYFENLSNLDFERALQ